jgi:hypothetical protein
LRALCAADFARAQQQRANLPRCCARRTRRSEVGALKFSFADTTTLFLTQIILFSVVEHKRLYDIKNPGSQGAPGSFLGIEAGLAGTGKVGCFAHSAQRSTTHNSSSLGKTQHAQTHPGDACAPRRLATRVACSTRWAWARTPRSSRSFR